MRAHNITLSETLIINRLTKQPTAKVHKRISTLDIDST